MDAQRVNLDGFAREEPGLGLVALRSPHDPEPGLVISGGRVTELDGVPEASFDAIDAYIARHGLAGAEGRSMLYLEARCVALARAIGAQGVQNGGIDGASVAASVPRGLRELMAENLMVMMRNLESCSGNDALTVPSGWLGPTSRGIEDLDGAVFSRACGGKQQEHRRGG
jgi:propanediol dehydratase large subunit